MQRPCKPLSTWVGRLGPGRMFGLSVCRCQQTHLFQGPIRLSLASPMLPSPYSASAASLLGQQAFPNLPPEAFATAIRRSVNLSNILQNQLTRVHVMAHLIVWVTQSTLRKAARIWYFVLLFGDCGLLPWASSLCFWVYPWLACTMQHHWCRPRSVLQAGRGPGWQGEIIKGCISFTTSWAPMSLLSPMSAIVLV